MSTIHKTRGEHPQPCNHVTNLDNEIMEAEVCTSTTKRMRPVETSLVVTDMEEMTGGAGRGDERACCRSEIECGDYGHGRRADQGGATE
eukprot:14929814-Heterocapsa_arctica.AAC.1